MSRQIRQRYLIRTPLVGDSLIYWKLHGTPSGFHR